MSLNPVSKLDLGSVWLTDRQTVQTARYVMEGHRIDRLTVVRQDGGVGFVAKEAIERALAGDTLEKFVTQYKLTIDGETTSRHAASLFVRDEITEAPVVENGQFLGLLTSNILLKELSRVWDPLTGLTWTEEVRAWGAEQLRMGRELTVIIFDVNGMSNYNAKFGHNEGDKLLQKIAAELTIGINAAKEILVRHSGDEFLIASLRSLEEAEALATKLHLAVIERQRMSAKEPIEFNFGISGGQRSGDRVSAHPEATLDDLIHLARERCELTKLNSHAVSTNVNSREFSGSTLSSGDKPRLIEVSQVAAHSSRYQVRILAGGREAVGTDDQGGMDPSMSISYATCRAIERLQQEMQITTQEVQGFREASGKYMATFNGTLKIEGKALRASGITTGEDNLAEAIARAVIEGVYNSISAVEEAKS